MAIPIADDFSFIRARLDEIETETQEYRGWINQPDPPRVADTKDDQTVWWCHNCQVRLTGKEIDGSLLHNPILGGCGEAVHPSCVHCNNQGWVMSPGRRMPTAKTCQHCFNPNGLLIP